MWNGRERVQLQACLHGLGSSFQPFTACYLHPHPPVTEGSNKVRTKDTSPTLGPRLPFIVTMFTHHSSRVLDVPLKVLGMGRSRGLGARGRAA